MTTFKRARSDEQRAARSQAILDTAVEMLAEMPVAELSLNELSRRVGLAKSNVLRYFESREAVLLQLLHAAVTEWIEMLRADLAAGVDPSAGLRERGDAVAAAFATSLNRHPLLCDLISAQAGTLERNVSTEEVLKFKHDSHADLARIIDAVLAHLPELGAVDAGRFVVHTVILMGALWTHAHPTEAVQRAYAAEPELADLQVDFVTALTEMAATVLSGIFARR